MATFEWEKAKERDRIRNMSRKPYVPVAEGCGECAIHQLSDCETCRNKKALLSIQFWRMKAHEFQNEADACVLCKYPSFYEIHSYDPIASKRASALERKIFNKSIDAIVFQGTTGGQERDSTV